MDFKKIGRWICVAASVLVIGTTVSGWVSDKNADKDTGNDVTVEQTIED